jgi:putative ABC transport system permease protein
VKRKYEIGVLRSIGASRSQIFYMFLLEILFVGSIGVLCGVPLAMATAKIIANFLPMPYIAYVGQPETAMEFVFSAKAILIGTFVGLVSTLVAGLIPSMSASRVEIVRALRPRIRVIRKRAKATVIIAFFGFIFVFSGLYLIRSGFAKAVQWWLLGPWVFLGYALTIIGVVLLTSLFLVPFSRALTCVFRPFIGGLATIIPRNITLNSRRSVFTYGALALSIAFIVTVGSLITTVASYELEVTKYAFGADIQVGVSAPYGFVQEIKSIEGVSNAAGVAYIWHQQSNVSFNGRYLRRGGVRMIGVNSADYFETIYEFHLVETLNEITPNQVYSVLVNETGNIIIQDALAQSLAIGVGDTLTWIYRNETCTLQKDFRVIGIADVVAGTWETIYKSFEDTGYYVAIVSIKDIADYRVSGGATLNYYDQFYVSLAPNANVTSVTEELSQKCRAYGYYPWIGAAADTMKKVQSAYNQVQALALAIIVFATVISALGVMATMAYAVLERKREIGILSALGVDKRQNIVLIIGETTTLTLLGLLIGLISGFALSYFIVQTIPWWSTIPPPTFAFSRGTIALSLTVTITAVLVSSAYPAHYAAKMAVTDALRM